MFCAISGQVPEQPVVSKNSGHLFEKRLIEKYIAAEGKCPVTKEDLTVEDLMELQSSNAVKPRPLQATSIPGLLGLFQNEWDDLMLETYTLKQHLDGTRQELSQALYQHDAACRVIARLIKERDTALEQVSTAQANIAQGAVADGEMEDVEDAGMTPAIVSKMEATSKTLQKGRRKRPAPEELASKEDIAAYDTKSSHTIHKSDKPGILCLALHPNKPNMVLTGGVDKVAQLFNRKTGKVESTLSGHGKKVTSVLFHPTDDVLITTSADKTAKIWAKSGKSYKAAHTIDCHSGEVTGCSLHATNDYLATCSTDASWAFHDINTGKTLMSVKDPNVGKGFGCAAFHPDGLILGTGTLDNLIRIWDMKTQQNVASFDGHTDVVNEISFSENGYHLASAGADGTVRLWDLRKLKNFKNLNMEGGGVVSSVCFDHSGNYLAAGGNDVRVFVVKQWEEIATYKTHTSAVTGVRFGKHATFLASTSMDRSLKFYGK